MRYAWTRARRVRRRIGLRRVLAAVVLVGASAFALTIASTLLEPDVAAQDTTGAADFEEAATLVIEGEDDGGDTLTPDDDEFAPTDPIEEVTEVGTTGAQQAPAVAPIGIGVPAGPTLPLGRWVLFDRFDQPVEAVVEPWCIESGDNCPEYGPLNPSCVWVEYLGAQRVRVPYRLADGRAEGCYSPTGLDRRSWTSPPDWIATALPDAPYYLELVYWD